MGEREVRVGEWGYEEREAVRVIYPDRHEIWVEYEEDRFELEEVIPNGLGQIALVTIYGNKKGFMTSRPPLEDLAWLNLRHYQKLSDLDHIEHVANVPILVATGVQDGEMDGIEIGPNRLINMSGENAKLAYVEHSGAAIAASQKSLEKLEERMAAMGADLIIRKSVDRQTATARLLDSSESVSILQVMVNNLERGLEEAYEWAGKWLNIVADDVVVSIGNFLDSSSGPNTVDVILNYIAANQGMTVDQATNELQRRGVLSDTFKTVNENEDAGETPATENEPAEESVEPNTQND